ncbi:class I SAM-dependent methyltransferase [Actinoplanes subtropicus]|uniref:class I SAM-dependent methyltransferase n=1 Tax=Actinoplanes subtropicus TaxID=543632 RepID=UPI0004C3EBB4|nr:class I SAM-dependent methyltransferase [Actinoplanes subtropicus]
MFTAQGPTFGELCVQALSSVERGYDLLAPKFDHTPFRTPRSILDATAAALGEWGPFEDGLDVCCGTGAGMLALRPVCDGRITGVDFSAGMLAQARAAHPDAAWVRADARALPFAAGFDLAVSFGAFGHFLPRERPAVFEGIHRALRPGGLFAFAIAAPLSLTSPAYWVEAGFDLVMRVRNAVWRPPFVMYYRTMPLGAVRADLTAAGFEVTVKSLGDARWGLILARKPVGSGHV